MDDLRKAISRSSFFSDKRDLKALALWPPSAGSMSLPPLAMPAIENVLSPEVSLCNSSTTEEDKVNGKTI